MVMYTPHQNYRNTTGTLGLLTCLNRILLNPIRGIRDLMWGIIRIAKIRIKGDGEEYSSINRVKDFSAVSHNSVSDR